LKPGILARCIISHQGLAQDQLPSCTTFHAPRPHRFGRVYYDGDTPADARKAIRERGHIVLSNPDMLHTGILPHHTRWQQLFENLRFVVLEELHTYRGVLAANWLTCCGGLPAHRRGSTVRTRNSFALRDDRESGRTGVTPGGN